MRVASPKNWVYDSAQLPGNGQWCRSSDRRTGGALVPASGGSVGPRKHVAGEAAAYEAGNDFLRGEEAHDSITKTAPVLATPRPFGHRIVRRLFTAGNSRHDARSRCHIRSLGQRNQWETRVSHDFASPADSAGFARSNSERTGMHIPTVSADHRLAGGAS